MTVELFEKAKALKLEIEEVQNVLEALSEIERKTESVNVNLHSAATDNFLYRLRLTPAMWQETLYHWRKYFAQHRASLSLDFQRLGEDEGVSNEN